MGDPDPRGDFRRDEGKTVLQVFGFCRADRSQKFSAAGKILGEEVADLALREHRPEQPLDDRREDQRQDDAEIVIHDGLKTDGHLRVHRDRSHEEQHAGLRVERNPALAGDREAEEEKSDEQEDIHHEVVGQEGREKKQQQGIRDAEQGDANHVGKRPPVTFAPGIHAGQQGEQPGGKGKRRTAGRIDPVHVQQRESRGKACLDTIANPKGVEFEGLGLARDLGREHLRHAWIS